MYDILSMYLVFVLKEKAIAFMYITPDSLLCSLPWPFALSN